MIKYHYDIIQGSEDWFKIRCGKLTASEMKHILTPTLKIADNERTRNHVWELLGQRVTKFVEPIYESFDMMRGKEEELDARIAYNENFSAVTDCGFVENDDHGFIVGCSPDGLVGSEGFLEAKSRLQKYQVQTYVENVANDTMPEEFALQVQTGFFVMTDRKWCDFISYSNGMPMAVVRVYRDDKIQNAILEAATLFEKKIAEKMAIYETVMADKTKRLIKTVRKNRDQDIRAAA